MQTAQLAKAIPIKCRKHKWCAGGCAVCGARQCHYGIFNKDKRRCIREVFADDFCCFHLAMYRRIVRNYMRLCK